MHRITYHGLLFVCSKHFRTEDVITEMDMPQPDGSLRKISRPPILRENAIPYLLPSCPKYLSTSSPKPGCLDHGKIESKLFSKALEQSLDLHKAEDSKFGVKSLGKLECKIEILNYLLLGLNGFQMTRLLTC